VFILETLNYQELMAVNGGDDQDSWEKIGHQLGQWARSAWCWITGCDDCN